LALRFPLEYDSNLPMVTFTPKTYKFPYGDGEKAEIKLENTSAGGLTSVALPIPGSFSESMGAAWAPQDVLGGTGGDVVDAGKKELVDAGKKLAGARVAGAMSARSGYTTTPQDVLIYNGPDSPKISFKFQMIPVSQKEGNTIVQIVKMFKKAQAPLASSQKPGQFLMYPAVWDITFVGANCLGYGTDDKYTWMALKSVSISYSGDTGIHVFYDKNPVMVDLSLDFECIKKVYDGT